MVVVGVWSLFRKNFFQTSQNLGAIDTSANDDKDEMEHPSSYYHDFEPPALIGRNSVLGIGVFLFVLAMICLGNSNLMNSTRLARGQKSCNRHDFF